MSRNKTTDTGAFTIRRAPPDDGARLAALYANAPDTGDFGLAPQFKIDHYVAYTQTAPATETQGLVAETDEGELAGAGFVGFSDLRVGGEVQPAAYLYGLTVQEPY